MSEKSKVEQKTATKTASKSKAAAVVSKPIAKKSAKDGLNKAEPKSKTTTKTASKVEPKSKVEAQKELFRTKSGHLVRSKSEVIIADYLYGEEICFAYEKRLPIETEARCDFYVPACSAYIEYWGVQSDEAERKKYEKRKKEKIALYKKHALNLIEIDDKNIKNLEDFLQKELLKLGLKVFK